MKIFFFAELSQLRRTYYNTFNITTLQSETILENVRKTNDIIILAFRESLENIEQFVLFLMPNLHAITPVPSNRFTAPFRNVFGFPDLYGSLFSEDYRAESDDEDTVVDVEVGREPETRHLLGRRKTSRAENKGNATRPKTFFLLIKSSMGTGVLFLPKAFKNGGLLFSATAQVVVALVSCVAMHLLLKYRERYGGGYSDIGEAIGGRKVRALILTSITVSQIGFVCVRMIFTAQNLNSFLEAVLKESWPLSTEALIGIQLVFLIPLALIRNMSKLSGTAFISSIFILFGLVYVYYFDISAIAREGINHTVQQFNPRDFTLTIRSVIFAFEGIGLVIPVQSSMREPQEFEKLLFIVLFIITIIFTTVKALNYVSFENSVKTEIISNLPQDNKLVNTVQFLYSLAVLVGTPIQLSPAIKIVEDSIFGNHSGKRDLVTKWKKNAFRTCLVCACAVIAYLGASNLDRFVALVCSFASVPLLYIYPAYLHFKGIADNTYVRVGDILLMVVGLIAMIYTTAVTVARWSES